MDTEELMNVAADVAAVAARHISETIQTRPPIIRAKSNIADLVTDADDEVERLIFRQLTGLRPKDGFIGEEGSSEESSSGVWWIVDPIDGTTNFVYGIPEYAVSVAAVVGSPVPSEWSVLAGAIAKPVTGEVFVAGRKKGSFLNGQLLEVLGPVPLNEALLLTGFSQSLEERTTDAHVLADFFPLLRDFRRLGATSINLAMVARGLANFCIERTRKPWDFAAGSLLVEEAGGRVMGLNDGPLDSGALFAGHPEMVESAHEVFLTLVNAQIARED